MTQAKPSLTPLEQRIVALTAEGHSAKEIARALSIAPRSVERHLETCRHKLGAANNAHLVAAAFGSGEA
jgi:LuxR family transcriptional regulator, transcriptional regulator of spore coat protein